MKKQSAMVLRNRPIPWWVWLLGGDLILLTATVVKKYPLSFPGKWVIVPHLNLATEMNLAVWWSGITLFLLALLAYQRYCRHTDKTRKAWLILAIIFTLFSLDEIGSIHERISGWKNLFLVGSLPLAFVVTALIMLFRTKPARWQAYLVLCGFLLLGSVVLQEYLEHLVDWPQWTIGIRRGVEEGTELLATFVFFLAVVGKRPSGQSPPLEDMLPIPASLSHLRIILTAGVSIHLLASLSLPGYVNLSQQGNPLIWFPTTLFFLLSLVAHRKFQDGKEGGARSGIFLSWFFLASSVAMMYPPEQLYAGLTQWVANEYLVAIPGVAGIAVLLIFVFRPPHAAPLHIFQVMVLFAAASAAFFLPAYGLKFLMPGVMPYLIFQILCKEKGPQEDNAENKEHAHLIFQNPREKEGA